MSSPQSQQSIRKPIYLDYAATTPVAPEVAAAMMGHLTRDGIFANPASRSHLYGWQAEEAVEDARGQVADLIGADTREIVWTSGATEANNLALKGFAENYRRDHPTGGHIIVSAIEHKAVLDPADWLASQGFRVTKLATNAQGVVELQALEQAIERDTFLISIMLVNNELGSINPVGKIVELAKTKGILVHTDAAQAIGKIPVNVKALGVDALSMSAHKFYGPKGIGALYVRRAADVKVAAQIHGGGHERGMRSGTLPTHQCVGMGKAAELVGQELATESARLADLKANLWAGLMSLPHIQRNGSLENSVPNILNLAFADNENQGCDGETLLLSLRDLAVSSGSACNSASMSPSYVLKAIGLTDAQAQSSLRFSLGRFTTLAEIEHAIEHIRRVVTNLKSA